MDQVLCGHAGDDSGAEHATGVEDALETEVGKAGEAVAGGAAVGEARAEEQQQAAGEAADRPDAGDQRAVAELAAEQRRRERARDGAADHLQELQQRHLVLREGHLRLEAARAQQARDGRLRRGGRAEAFVVRQARRQLQAPHEHAGDPGRPRLLREHVQAVGVLLVRSAQFRVEREELLQAAHDRSQHQRQWNRQSILRNAKELVQQCCIFWDCFCFFV